MYGSVWYSVDRAIVGQAIWHHVGDVEVITKFGSVCKFKVLLSFFGELPDEVHQFFGRFGSTVGV